MERSARSTIVGLFCDEPFTEGETRLCGGAAQHARVRRVQPGDPVRLLNGRGRVATGSVLAIAKGALSVSVERVVEEPRGISLDVVIPVADRDRMLIAAEKCVELAVTGWRPAYFARSRSVAPRGEGDRFREKVLARMRSALEQSGGTWLPELHSERDAVDALESVPALWTRLLLDANGRPLPHLVSNGPMAIAVGPEGGFEQHERARASDAGWTIASLGTTTLRFETAVIAGAAVVRATQLSMGKS